MLVQFYLYKHLYVYKQSEKKNRKKEKKIWDNIIIWHVYVSQ